MLVFKAWLLEKKTEKKQLHTSALVVPNPLWLPLTVHLSLATLSGRSDTVSNNDVHVVRTVYTTVCHSIISLAPH